MNRSQKFVVIFFDRHSTHTHTHSKRERKKTYVISQNSRVFFFFFTRFFFFYDAVENENAYRICVCRVTLEEEKRQRCMIVSRS